jgi:hypothetical protein
MSRGEVRASMHGVAPKNGHCPRKIEHSYPIDIGPDTISKNWVDFIKLQLHQHTKTNLQFSIVSVHLY